VDRYLNLVYSTALRLVNGDAHLAEDVSQTVFADLAGVANSLSKEVKIGGWLHRHTCFVAANTMRGERRRRLRERQAAEMNTLQPDSRTGFSTIAPILDQAINELGEMDRSAILLRFFEQLDFHAVGKALGRDEDAARMRVNRALEKLADALKRQGVTVGTAALALSLPANAVHAAPAGLALSISATAAVTAATSTTVAAKAIIMTTLQKTVIGTTLALAVGTGLYEARHAAGVRQRNELLEQQKTSLTDQIQQLQRERDEARGQLTGLAGERGLPSPQEPPEELLKLRGDVTRLRQQLAEAQGVSVQANDTFTRSVLGLVERAAQLNQHLEQMPEKKIPELYFLGEHDWVNVAKSANLDSDAGIRKAFRRLRNLAKSKVPMGKALISYTSQHDGELPTDISQLRAYFVSDPEGDPDWNWNQIDPVRDSAVIDAVLNRYKLVQTGNIRNLPQDAYIIVEKTPVDKDYDSRAKFGLGRSSITDTGLGETGDPDDKSY
jgi:RNA polymerase sigma factor (sigma-70 family)